MNVYSLKINKKKNKKIKRVFPVSRLDNKKNTQYFDLIL